jgi:Protein of unknown function (DUF2877)
MSSLEISTTSVAPTARAWLTNTHEARVLHVFDRACNLINERGEVLSIVTPHVGNDPFNLVVEDDVLFSEHLNIESPISIQDNQLILGDLTVNTANAKLWSPRPDWGMLHAQRNNILAQIMALRANASERSNLWQREEIASSVFSSASLHSDLLATTLPQLPFANYQSLLSNLSSALASADISTAKAVASKLAGLGQGLTPAGDDFIMGALYAAWIIHPLATAKVLAEEIANTAAPLTTSLSAVWLRSAGRGEAGILWHDFLDTLVSADPARVQEAMDKILAVGETSGEDAMAGFIRLFMHWAEHCSNL